jgi:Zinc knuckle
LVNRLKKQNDCVQETSEIKVVNIKKNPRGVVCLLEVDQQTHESMLSAGRVFIGWDSCRVYQHIDILRCFKCSQFGHRAANCTHEICCAKCSGNHDGKECNSEVEKCANCVWANEQLKLGLDVKHASYSLKCPSYLRKVRLLSKNK